MTREEQWNLQYEKVLEYYKIYNNINISANCEFFIGDEKFTIGQWLRRQRKNYELNKLTQDQINKLNDLKFSWQAYKTINDEKVSLVHAKKWLVGYNAAKKYYNEHNNLLVPVPYVIALDNGEKFDLGSWLDAQRRAYNSNKLKQYKLDLLENLKMQWRYKECKAASYANLVATRIWIERFNLLKEYYDEHKDILIPEKYCAFVKGKKVILRNWIMCQRRAYKQGKLSQDQIDLLESIGMNWCVDDKTRIENLKLHSLKKWYRKYDVIKKVVSNGFKIYSFPEDYELSTIDGESFIVKNWLNSQIAKYNKGELDEHQISILEEIGLIFYKKAKIKK